MDFSQQKTKLSDLLAEASKADILARNSVETTEHQITTLTSEQKKLKEQVELLRLASVILQQLIDDISVKNIQRVEVLVNTALYNIFKDQDIQFKILKDIKRGQVLYRIVLVQNGTEGGYNSFGGGILSAVAVVLKAIILILSKRYPLLVFDESLSFVSSEYREATSKFLHDLTKPSPDGLGTSILMVTHDPEYSSGADHVYQAHSIEGGTTFKKK